MTERATLSLFRVLGLAFGGAAVFHLVALARPDLAEPAPPWRHGLFAALNLGVALGMLRPTRLFAWLFALFTLQQLASHGAYAWHLARTEGRVDWASAVVLVTLPAIAALVFRRAHALARPNAK